MTFRRRNIVQTLLPALSIIMMGIVVFNPSRVVAATDSSSIQYTPEIGIPGLFDSQVTVDSSLMATYIRAIFVYFIWVVGIIATVMVVYGGIRWVAAAGNSGQIREARDIVDNAVIGVIIALSSVVLLNIINPKLSHISVPGLQSAGKDAASTLTITGLCSDAIITSTSLPCGGTYKLPSTSKAAGDSTSAEYCISPYCPGDQICFLNKTSAGKWTTGIGCQSSISVNAKEGLLQGDRTVTVSNINGYIGKPNAAQSVPVHCGDVSVSNNGTSYTSSQCDGEGRQFCVGTATPVVLEGWSTTQYPSLGESGRYTTKSVSCIKG